MVAAWNRAEDHIWHQDLSLPTPDQYLLYSLMWQQNDRNTKQILTYLTTAWHACFKAPCYVTQKLAEKPGYSKNKRALLIGLTP